MRLGFLASGGDGYAVFGDATNRVDLTEQMLEGDLLPDVSGDGVEGIGGAGTEQDALAEYLAANFSQTPFDRVDTPPAQDERIRNLQLLVADTTPPVCGEIEILTESGVGTAVRTTATDEESRIASVTFTRLFNLTGQLDGKGRLRPGRQPNLRGSA